MYIPRTNHPNPDPSQAPATRLGAAGLTFAHELATYHNLPFPIKSISVLLRRLLTRSLNGFSTTLEHSTSLGKRSGISINTTIGVVVGILLAAFVIGFFAFVYVYGRSIHFAKKKRHRRKSSGSKGSKNSEGAAAGGEPPAAA
ncbi:hypothetical protein F5Y06DRAFT_155860 [Hypoxylon sp. FL0890]|nr:hypothetical protein F5Y06DRAFT_155860 [Hypoxylon sp. FL0890]